MAQSGSVGHARFEIPELEERKRERSPKTHAVRVQSGKLCMRAKRSSALRLFRTEYSRRGQRGT
eukprot:831192-Pleurochrysis_carterae.AAC.2